MLKEKFEAFVAQFAKYYWTSDPGAYRSKHHKTNTDIVGASIEIEQWLPRTEVCADCAIVADKCIVRTASWNHSKKQWNIRCTTCKSNWNKNTGKFVKGNLTVYGGNKLPACFRKET
jgi:hypothetical protein